MIALAHNSTLASKKTWALYHEFIQKFESELAVLLDVSESNLLKTFPNETLLVELIMLGRKSKLKVKPGFDGEYGKVLMPEKQEKLF